jgi:hypothetical protein
MASDTQQEVFIPLAGAAPGQGGLLVGINPGAVAFVYGAWDKSIKQNVLRLHMCSDKTVQIEDEETIEHVLEHVLEHLGLAGAEWQLRLEDLESKDT